MALQSDPSGEEKRGPRPRQENLFQTAYLKLSTTPQVLNALDELVDRGLYGKTPTEVAEGLLRTKLLELNIPADVLKRERKPPHRTEPKRAKRESA